MNEQESPQPNRELETLKTRVAFLEHRVGFLEALLTNKPFQPVIPGVPNHKVPPQETVHKDQGYQSFRTFDAAHEKVNQDPAICVQVPRSAAELADHIKRTYGS